MRWYKRDPDAALAGMIGLSLEERAIYNTIIDLLYSRDGEIPTDDGFFSRACECRPQVWRRVRDSLIAKGKLRYRADGKLTANRVENELQTAGKLIARMKVLGQVSTEKRSKNKEPPPTERKTQPQPHPEKKEVGGGGDAGAREPSNIRPLVSEAAMSLATDIAAIVGYPTPPDWPPGWCGAPMRVQAMLDHGWKPEIMLSATRAAMAKKRDGPPDTINYFEKPFARAHAQQSAPFPVVRISEPEMIDGTARQAGDASHRNGRGGASLAAIATGRA